MSHTLGPWDISEVRSVEGEYLVVGGEGGGFGLIAAVTEADDTRLIAASPDLYAVLQRYMAAYPAFRIKPEGAPGSPKRVEQENLMALEDAARAAITRVLGSHTQGDRE